jgi:prepilin-type N-terminal cleavage/methylation domain-containing protein
MNKRGFTLVELLAIIVILGVILVIAIPKVSESINISKIEAFIKDEEELVRATESFIAQNVKYIPQNIGDTKEVKLSDLQNEKFIYTVVNPNDNKATCNGYVLVTKTGDKKYDYVPHLNCEKNISSSSEDGLVGHYSFDNFAEATTNLLPNPLNFTWSAWPSTANGWNVTNQSMTSDYDSDGQMTKFTITAGTVTGSSYLQIFSGNNSITSGKTYGLSFYAKAKVGRKLSMNMIQNASPYTTYVTGTTTVNVTTEWQRFEVTFTSNYTATDARIQFNTGYDLWNDELYIYKPQLEERAPTPFVNGTRLGAVTDYSLNSNDATLAVATTPKWVNTAAIGDGAYDFDGVNDYIDLGAVSNNIMRQGTEANDFTLSTWIKTTGNQDSSSKIILGRMGWNAGLQAANDGRVFFTLWDEANNARTIYSQALTNNVYHNVVGVYSNKIMYLYIDGKLAGTNNYFSLNPTVRFRVNAANFTVGAGSSTLFQFRGSIDDVLIYTRSLTDVEIKHNYDIESYKLNK